MARPVKKISDLSPERLRKLTPYERQQRKEAEKRIKQAKKTQKITNTTIKKYLKSVVNEDTDLTELEAVLPYVNELHFIEDLIQMIKKDIVEHGVIDEMRTTNPLLKEYNALVKQKGAIIKEISSILKKKNSNREDDNSNNATLDDLFKILA